MMAQNDSRFTPTVVGEVEGVLKSEGGALTKWNAILEILTKQNIAYKRQVHPDELFTHPRNRSGMGINAYNVHRNLNIITTIGADREHLRKSTAFEMFPVCDKRSEQIAFNEHLVNHAGGLLAPPTGKEKYLTVASSHFSAEKSPGSP